MTSRYSTDIVIFGGGIAGLWLLASLRQQGYKAILLESRALGSGQTLASQGIIHGGLKYALSGALSGASQTIAGMPARWRAMLGMTSSAAQSGPGDLALSGVKVLSEHYYMWSDGSFRSRLKNFLGSKSLRGRVDTVAANDYPAFFSAAPADRGTLYRLPDFVVDTPSLLKVLSAAHRSAIYHYTESQIDFSRTADGKLSSCHLQSAGNALQISARRFVFAAGEGNEQLLKQAGIESISTQTRPLHMVHLSKAGLPAVYLHCIGSDFGLTPKLTLTSHPGTDDNMTWYLGGELAEAGVQREAAAQIAAAQAELANLFPWVDLRDATWQSLRINRAEAGRDNNVRPDDAVLTERDNALIVWPTKLTLAPALADRVLEQLSSDNVQPGTEAEDSLPLPLAEIARAHWE